MLKIPLKSSANNQPRIDFLTVMLNNAEAKMNHIDGLRQRNMSIAAIIFGGMFSFAFQSTVSTFRPLSLAALTLIMFVFTLLDRRLHRFHHGWRETRGHFVEAIRDVINDPNNDITVQRYYQEGEEEAEWGTLRPILYYLLVVAAIVALSLLLAKVI
jgi:hypothetical protein